MPAVYRTIAEVLLLKIEYAVSKGAVTISSGGQIGPGEMVIVGTPETLKCDEAKIEVLPVYLKRRRVHYTLAVYADPNSSRCRMQKI